MRLFFTTIMFCLALAMRGAAANAPVLPFLEVKGERYTNVVVTGASENRLFIRHNRGLATLRVEDLSRENQEDLGLQARSTGKKTAESNKPLPPPAEEPSAHRRALPLETPAPPVPTGPMAAVLSWIFGQSWPENQKSLVAACAEVKTFWETCIHSTTFWWWVGVCGPLLYVIYCAALHKICEKSGQNGSLVVALPILRWHPLFTAAGMPGGLFLIGLFAFVALVAPPVLPALGQAKLVYLAFAATLQLVWIIVLGIWCGRICRALGRTRWLGILLFVPVFHFFAVLLLARSRGRREAGDSHAGAGIAFKVT